MNIMYLFICLRPDGPWNTHTQTIILLRLEIFQYDLKCNTFTHGKLPQGKKTIHTSTSLLLKKSL